MDERIIAEVADTLRSGWITTGPKTRRFEEMLTAYCGHPETVCVNSATAGLELALRWFGVGPGDEVILPAYTYASSANVVVHCGAKPVFVDIMDDFNIDPQQVIEAITPSTRAVIPVDIGGWPCDYGLLNKLVASPEAGKSFRPVNGIQEKLGRILLLADAAHSLGAEYKGKKTGNLADISVFSFHAVKNLTTAEGGAICLNLPEPFSNSAIRDQLRIKALHGQTKDALTKSHLGSWQYDIIEPGYKYNMTDLQASIGIIELERYERDMLKRRREIFHLYAKLLQSHDWAVIPPCESEEKRSSFHVFLLRVKDIDESQRNRIIEEIAKENVAVNVHFRPLPMMSWYVQQGYDIAGFPRSYKNYSQEISLPVYYDLTDEDVATVADAVVRAVNSVTG